MRALVLSLVLGACSRSPVMTMYLKGPPQRVTVVKHAESGSVEYRAMRSGSTVRLSVSERTRVRLERTVAKSTYVLEGRGDWWWEWIETVIGVAALPALPFLIGKNPPVVNGPDVRLKHNGGTMTGMLDPRRTAIGATFSGRVSTDDAFAEPAQHRRYRVSLPVQSAKLHYRVITAERAVALEGQATTSRFGEIEIANVPDDAVGIEIIGKGRTQLIVIEDPR